MKIKDGYLLKEIAGNFVVVPVGNVDFDGMISSNETGVFIWKKLENETTFDAILADFLNEYEIDEATAKSDLEAFLTTMRSAGLLYES